MSTVTGFTTVMSLNYTSVEQDIEIARRTLDTIAPRVVKGRGMTPYASPLMSRPIAPCDAPRLSHEWLMRGSGRR